MCVMEVIHLGRQRANQQLNFLHIPFAQLNGMFRRLVYQNIYATETVEWSY